MITRSESNAVIAALFALAATPAAAALADDGPPEVPATRPELKAFLEASKRNAPRLPMPPLSEADREKMAGASWSSADWSVYNNGRMRKHYLPAELADVSVLRGDDPAMTLGNRFQTMLFWIVSRANNCTYCMGHQESKLAAAGMVDDEIAELDGDWSAFTPRDRAAFGLARKLTYEPHRMARADIDALRPHFNDAQILEVVNAVANFNSMNRWTGALRIPQEEHRVYLTPTAAKFRELVSRQAPLDREARRPGRACAKPAARPPLESRAEVEAALASCRDREPRLPLASEDAARAAMKDESPGPVPAWIRLLAAFPKAGPARVKVHRASETRGVLDPLLRAQIAWIAARNDRAWYALGHARARLLALGQDDDAIYRLDRADLDNIPARRRAVYSLARKLTVDPALVADADVEAVRAQFPDREVAEIVFQVTEAAYFDRLTEAAGLPLEP
ncbi:hypothetical protein OJF2_75490 [Aquisphaera giovannonii]|uniref:Carboxymuconolactone decarboxylase family protein n=1 Tax=Aquisphaera giovannonii TaxID=406548 RepID=A0A5B9WFA0_9BACT|nr:hypothetical protein [Aquisphaera giovannonii]QEH38939.1 hypothetical protein OJF2_75490 [Aquisphaera giovannonii]